MNLFRELFNYPEMCIYGLINSMDKKIYLGYTCNLPHALSRIIKELKYSNGKLKEDLNKLELIILEPIADRKNLRIKYKDYSNKYSNEGWILYRKDNYSNVPRYKLRIDIIGVGETNNHDLIKVEVNLLTRRYKKVTVGVFNDIETATNWVMVNYPKTDNITNIVYAEDQWKS